MSRGPRAKTDQIDTELIARVMVFRPDGGRSLPAQKRRHLRVLTGKRGQIFEMRKRLLTQIKARQKQGLGERLEGMDDAFRILLTAPITKLESHIGHLIEADKTLAETGKRLRCLINRSGISLSQPMIACKAVLLHSANWGQGFARS